MITIIFDVDGTLIDSMEFDGELYINAVIDIVGNVQIHDDWNKYENVTDAGILKQIFCENEIQNIEENISRIRTRFGELIQAHLADNPCKAIPGAIEAVKELQGDSDYAIGIATGGWGHTAAMKLQSAGFSLENIPLLSSDDHYKRTAIMELCRNNISQNNSKVVYVGDCEWDINATSALGWGFIGIGERLKGKADAWIADFSSENWKRVLEKAIMTKG